MNEKTNKPAGIIDAIVKDPIPEVAINNEYKDRVFKRLFLVAQREEVSEMFLSEYDEEEVRRLWAEDARAEGIKEGEKAGEKRKALEAAKKLKAAGVDISIIAECEGLSVGEIEKL